MNKANERINKILIMITALFCCVTSAYADEHYIMSDAYGRIAEEQALAAANERCEAHLNPLINASIRETTLPAAASIRASRVIGGRNFSAADVDNVMIPISSSNGIGMRPLFHDGGEWPNTGGVPSVDDGSASGESLAKEIYDFDRNNHYPKACLRYIGTHCYIFVPIMFYPTLPKSMSSSEATTPAPNKDWGMTWPHNRSLYFAPDAGGNVREPRYVLGTDKASAKYALQKLADKFDTEIYPQMREYLGNEPDIDGDSKIFILLDDIRDSAGSYKGYFWSGNQIPNMRMPLSNEKEILYIDILQLSDNREDCYGTVAHEFCHMIMFNNGYDIVDNRIMGLEVWLEEGITTFLEHKFTNMFSSNLDFFIARPGTQLVENSQAVWGGGRPFANYGASFLFMYYICEKYGSSNLPGFLRTIVSHGKNTGDYSGISCVNAALKPFETNMQEVFKDWCIANILDRTTKNDLITPLNNGKWGYKVDNDRIDSNNIGRRLRLPVMLTETVLLSSDSTVKSSSVNPWAASYIKLEGNTGNLNLAFDGDDRTVFAASAIKQGKYVETAVEDFYLNDKQAGNLVIQNYGSSGTYENVILVAMQTGTYNEKPMSYVYAGTFAELRAAIFPNPMFENALHVVVKSDKKFASEPRVQMTYDAAQWYMTMAPVDEYTYISNYKLKTSGEGTLVVTGTNQNGALLTNTLRFSAVYYPPKSEGALKSSFARLNIPSNAFKEGCTLIATKSDSPASYEGITRLSSNVDIAMSASPEEDLRLSIPLEEESQKLSNSNKNRLGLYRATSEGKKWVGKASLKDGAVSGNIRFSGTVFAAFDDTPPAVNGEPKLLDKKGFISIPVIENGSGLCEESIRASANGKELPTYIDNGNLIIDSSSLDLGKHDFEIKMADNAGNEFKYSTRASGGVPALKQVTAYPNPARNRSVIRATFTGDTIEPAVKIYDVSGHKVCSGILEKRSTGTYEFVWDLLNEKGKRAANGVYFAEVKTSVGKQQIKLAVLR